MAKRISKKWIVCIIVFLIAGTYYFLHRPVKNLSIDSVSQNQDAYISSLLLTLKAKDGTEASKLIYQPTVIPGEDYIVKATKMYLDGKEK